MELMIFLIGIIIILVIVFVKRHFPSKDQVHKRKHDPLYLERMAEIKRQAEERGDMETVQAVLEDRYDQMVQERALKKQAEIAAQYTTYNYNIAGINFRKGIRNYVGEFTGYLIPEPNNQYDHNAIAVHHSDGHNLGYIPADKTDDVRALHLRFPIPTRGKIVEDYDYDESRYYYRGNVLIEIKNKKK